MDIEQQRREIIEKFGEWTNHNIRLPGDVYTIDPAKMTGAEVKVKRYLQIIADITSKPFSSLRVLDLACLEGLYGIELALQGARVVGIEGREANLEKARFAKKVMGLNRLELCQDDVRNLSVQKYGKFDVVLCLGIFYHLDVPDVLQFMENIADVCEYLAIVDTHVSRSAEVSYVYQGKKYTGRSHREHSDSATPQEKIDSLWSSLDNPQSFWLTRASLYNLMSNVGFTSVYECYNPPVMKYEMMRSRKEADRATFVGIKGQKTTILSSAAINQIPTDEWTEL